ncbi:hypothetical protein RYX36_034306, partial [Vicia faba]
CHSFPSLFFISFNRSQHKVIEPKNDVEMRDLWTQCLRSSKRGARKVAWKFIEIEIFCSYKSSSNGSLRSCSPSDSNTALVSSFSSSTRSFMKLSTSNKSSYFEEAININSTCLEDD